MSDLSEAAYLWLPIAAVDRFLELFSTLLKEFWRWPRGELLEAYSSKLRFDCLLLWAIARVLCPTPEVAC